MSNITEIVPMGTHKVVASFYSQHPQVIAKHWFQQMDKFSESHHLHSIGTADFEYGGKIDGQCSLIIVESPDGPKGFHQSLIFYISPAAMAEVCRALMPADRVLHYWVGRMMAVGVDEMAIQERVDNVIQQHVDAFEIRWNIQVYLAKKRMQEADAMREFDKWIGKNPGFKPGGIVGPQAGNSLNLDKEYIYPGKWVKKRSKIAQWFRKLWA